MSDSTYTSAVQIVINVSDTTSGPVTAGAIQNLQKIGAAAAGIRTQFTGAAGAFQSFGTSGTIAGRMAAKALDEVGEAGLNAREKLHLATEELGIRMPRAFRSLIQESHAATAVINSMGSALIGLGAIQIGYMVFSQLIEGAGKAYDKFISLESALADVDETLKKIGEDGTEAIERQISATERYIEITKGAGAADRFRLQNLQNKPVDLSGIYGDDKFRKLPDSMKGGIEGITGESIEPKDLDATIQKVDLYNQGLQRTLALMQKVHSNPDPLAIPTEAGKPTGDYSDQDLKRVGAQLQIGQRIEDDLKDHKVAISAEIDELNARIHKDDSEKHKGTAGTGKADQEAEELRKLHEEAVESGLRGTALLHAQEIAALDELKQKGIATAQAINDTRAKFHNEEMKREQEETGKVSHAYEEMFKASREAHERDLAEQQKFTDRVNALVEDTAMSQVQGYARIHAEAQRSIAQLQAENPGNESMLGLGTAMIRQREGDQVAERDKQNREETEQLESQARAKFLNSEKNQTAAIQDELKERLLKLREEKDAELITVEDYNRRVVAANQLAQAEMADSARQAREKMAGEFTSFFKDLDHPLKALAALGDKVAGQAAAALMQRLQTHFGAHGSMSTIYDKIAGVQHPGQSPTGASAHGIAGASTMSVGSAQIIVSSGTILLGGGGGGAPGRPTGAGGSTPGALSFGSSTSGSSSGISFGGSTSSPAFSSSSASSTPGSGNGPVSMDDLSGGQSFGTGWGSSSSGAGSANVPGQNRGALAMGDVSKGLGLVQKAGSIFSGGRAGAGSAGAGSSADSMQTTSAGEPDQIATPGTSNMDMNAPGLQQNAAGNGSMIGGGVTMSNAMGAASGALGLYSAYQGNGGVGGALNGAMSGMELGMAVGGPIGAAIGAAAGAVLGAFGFGGREKARVYDLRQVRPHIAADYQSFEAGGMDYLSAYSDMETLDRDAERTTKQWGPEAHAYYNDTIRHEIMEARGRFDQMERAGRSNYTATQASYAVGTDFVPQDGPYTLHQGESVNTRNETSQIGRLLDVASSSTVRPAQSSGFGGDIHLHAIDAKSSLQFLMNNKHAVRSALNQSYADDSGGADAGY